MGRKRGGREGCRKGDCAGICATWQVLRGGVDSLTFSVEACYDFSRYLGLEM